MDTVAADYLAITRFGGNNIEIFAVMYSRLSVIDANDQKAPSAAESFLFDGAGQFFAVKAGQIGVKSLGVQVISKLCKISKCRLMSVIISVSLCRPFAQRTNRFKSLAMVFPGC